MLKLASLAIVEKDGKLFYRPYIRQIKKFQAIIYDGGYKSFCGLIIFIKLHQIYFL